MRGDLFAQRCHAFDLCPILETRYLRGAEKGSRRVERLEKAQSTPRGPKTATTALGSRMVDQAFYTLENADLRSIAVLITDMVGSTEFAEKHGCHAAFLKRKQHNALLSPLVARHKGILVEIVGDSMLAIFDSVKEAADCAIEMQGKLFEHNKHVDVTDREIHIRSGIHFGNAVVYTQQNGRCEVCGRAVNACARIASFADSGAGQIVISEIARAKLPPDHYMCWSLGEMDAKGIGTISVHGLSWCPTTTADRQQHRDGYRALQV